MLMDLKFAFTTGHSSLVVSALDCYPKSLLIKSSTLPLLKHTCGEVTSCHTGRQDVSIYNIHLCQVRIRLPTLAMRRHHQKSETGVLVAPQKGLMSSKIFLKKHPPLPCHNHAHTKGKFTIMYRQTLNESRTLVLLFRSVPISNPVNKRHRNRCRNVKRKAVHVHTKEKNK